MPLPSSKAISEYGAYNQRGFITVEIRSRPGPDLKPEIVWIEELVEMAEASASAPLYPLLKREDERHVTMEAYDNPAFVEDLVREFALRLKEDQRIVWFRVHWRFPSRATKTENQPGSLTASSVRLQYR